MKSGVLSENGRHIFISMNSSEGFVSYFDEYINSLNRVYVLKGGPGTGKSGLMKYFGEQAQSLGYSPLYIHCSSDPDSLDGVIIEEIATGIFDGTSPHVIEPKFPGVRDEIINLGQFWDSSLLQSKKDEILSLCDKKAISYKRAEEKLSLCGGVMQSSLSKLSKYFDSEAAEKKAKKFCDKFKEKLGSKRVNFTARAIGMKGITNINFPSEYKVVYIESYYGAEYLMLREIEKELSERTIDRAVSYSPLLPQFADTLVIPDEKTIFTTIESDCKKKTIKASDYVKNIPEETKKELSSAKGMSRVYLAEALDAFARMRDFHFGLEKIYSRAMDFSKKEDCQKALVKKVFNI